MTVSQFGVAKALLDRLNTIEGGSLEVVPQGASYTPNGTDPYIRELLLSPDREFVQDYKTGTRQDGVYQIDVLTPKSGGKWQNLALVDQVKGLWTQSEIITDAGTGQDVKISSIAAGQLLDREPYWMTPVSVYYTAFG